MYQENNFKKIDDIYNNSLSKFLTIFPETNDQITPRETTIISPVNNSFLDQSKRLQYNGTKYFRNYNTSNIFKDNSQRNVEKEIPKSKNYDRK